MRLESTIITRKLNLQVTFQSGDLITNGAMTDIIRFEIILIEILDNLRLRLLSFEDTFSEEIDKIGK